MLYQVVLDAQERDAGFLIEPVELTLHVVASRTGPEPDRIEWRVLDLGGDAQTGTGGAHRLTMRFTQRSPASREGQDVLGQRSALAAPAAADADGDGPDAVGEVQRLPVARVRLGAVPAPADPQAPVIERLVGVQVPRARLVVELQAASVPADRMGGFDAAVRMLREAHPAPDAGGRLVDATAAYFAERVDNQTRTVWATPGPLDLAELTTVLDRWQQSLLESVKRQVEGLASLGGAPAPAAELAGGIGADFILAPEMRLEEGVSSIIDICVMGIGFATGQPHLVAAAGKHLLHTEFDQALEHGAAEILNGLFNPAASAAPEPAAPDPGTAAERLADKPAGEPPRVHPLPAPDHPTSLGQNRPTPRATTPRRPPGWTPTAPPAETPDETPIRPASPRWNRPAPPAETPDETPIRPASPRWSRPAPPAETPPPPSPPGQNPPAPPGPAIQPGPDDPDPGVLPLSPGGP